MHSWGAKVERVYFFVFGGGFLLPHLKFLLVFAFDLLVFQTVVVFQAGKNQARNVVGHSDEAAVRDLRLCPDGPSLFLRDPLRSATSPKTAK